MTTILFVQASLETLSDTVPFVQGYRKKNYLNNVDSHLCFKFVKGKKHKCYLKFTARYILTACS